MSLPREVARVLLTTGSFDTPITDASEETLVAESLNIFEKTGVKAAITLKLLQRGILLANDVPQFLRNPQPSIIDDAEEDEQDATSTATSENAESGLGVRRTYDYDNHNANGNTTGGGETSTGQASTFELTEEERHATDLEREALIRERKGDLRSLTRTAITTLCLCAVAAAAQGMVQETIVGANVSWPADPVMGLATTTDNGGLHFEGNGLLLFSLVNAIPYLAAGLIGAWLSDPLTYAFGRRATLFVAGFCTFAAAIGAYYSQTWYQLLVCRLIQGVGIGSKSSVVPIIIAESYPRELRGRLLVLWQASVAFGIFIGSCTNIIFHSYWRTQIGICFASALPLVVLCFAVPE